LELPFAFAVFAFSVFTFSVVAFDAFFDFAFVMKTPALLKMLGPHVRSALQRGAMRRRRSTKG
jgi:hypothetical protein